jgi:hypothetical protein
MNWSSAVRRNSTKLMNHLSTLLNTSRILAASLLVFGLASAGAQASRAVDHSLEYKAMSMKDDLAHRSPDNRDGTVFRWTTFGLAIESKVHEYVLNQRLGWYGYVPGAKPSFYHSWYLEPRGAMCHVVMDEAGVGKDAAGLRKSDETLMHRGHDLWLATLKWVAEAK